ncbi:class I SAM-dependent methyltransferase, partial [Nostoc sp. NIES-2111]
MQFLGFQAGIPEYRPPSAWLEHGPFGMWLVRVLRPRRIVELGTHHGYSCFSFCQAVLESGLDTNCFAVDTWSGDEHAGHYDEDVYRGVLANNGRYAHFSRLLRKTFDSALADIEDRSVDLLHIDGRHFYDDVKGDFESWLPKLSPSAVVVFHDVE